MLLEHDSRLKQYLIFRLLIILLGFGLVTFYQLWLEPAFRQHTFRYLYSLLGIYLLFGLTLTVTYPRWRQSRASVRGQVFGDFFIQSLLIWGTGGVFSIFSPLLFVTLVAATSVISARGAFVLATLATIFLTTTTIAYSFGVSPVISNRVDWLFANESSAFVVSYLLGSVLALYTISTLGSHFSHGLRRVQGMQNELLENIGEGLISVDMEGRVLQLNRETRKLLGFSEKDSSRRTDIDSLFVGKRYKKLRSAFQQDERWCVRTAVGAPGGALTPVEVHVSTVFDDRGQPRCRIGLVSDLTLKREVEAAEQRIQKLEDLQVMSLGIAHEIRNPLASIRGCVQEISRLVPSGTNATRFMEIVCRESDRLDSVIEDFLAYTRSGPINLVPLDLFEVVEDAVLLLKSRPEFGSRTLTVSRGLEHPIILGDRDRLIQVFLNLGINAMEATSPTDGCIEVALRPRPFTTMAQDIAGRDLVPGVEVEIKDNGEGIQEPDLERVCTPFFMTKKSGNGLGLSVVGRIVRDHLGALDIQSSEGRGASFRLWFPLQGAASETLFEEDITANNAFKEIREPSYHA